MPKENYISAKIFCKHHRIEYSFIRSLSEHGLLTIATVEEDECVPESNLVAIEKFIHLYYDLQINMEGIEAITHLLNKVEGLQEQITSLQNKLERYR